MKYRCVIIDDETLAQELIQAHLLHFPEFSVVGSFGSAIEARTFDFSQVDLLFLDIEMPVLKGIDFFKLLHPKPAVIFTTAYRDYAIEGFDLAAVDYLLKPITFQRFYQAIKRFQSNHSIRSSRSTVNEKAYIFVRSERKQVKLPLAEILYIEALKDYICIYLTTRKYVVKHTLKDFIPRLDNRFVQIHRSFVVNKDQITAYTKHDIEINDTEIPVGAQFKASLEQLD